MALSPSPVDAAVRYCLPVVSGAEQSAASEAEGKRLALESWVQHANVYGPQYAGWHTATAKSLSCRRTAASGPSGKGVKDAKVGFACQARASPCTITQVPLPPGRPPATRPPGGKAIEA